MGLQLDEHHTLYSWVRLKFGTNSDKPTTFFFNQRELLLYLESTQM
jgi:hypothetical protein